MQDQPQNNHVDFGNFQLDYSLNPSSHFPNSQCIDESYVATLQFSAPGAGVSVALTNTQLEFWRDFFELSVTRGGVDMKTLPIMCTRKEDTYLYAVAYNNTLFFRSATMSISINLADCLKEFTSYLDEIYCKLKEKEEESWRP